MTNDRVIDLLQEAYNDELETLANYLANGISLHGVRGEQVGEALLADVQEELNHAQVLAERLNTLGETPRGSFELEMSQESLQPPEGNDVESVIRGVLDAERGAVETYRELIVEAADADDFATEDLAIELLNDEENHYAEFRDYAEEYDMDVDQRV